MTRNASPQNPVRAVCAFNLFLFRRFCTLWRQWRLATLSVSIVSALFPMQRRERAAVLSLATRLAPLCALSLGGPRASRGDSRGHSPARRLSGGSLTPSPAPLTSSFVCFHALTSVPICKSFAAKCFQQYRGWMGGPAFVPTRAMSLVLCLMLPLASAHAQQKAPSANNGPRIEVVESSEEEHETLQEKPVLTFGAAR